MVKPNHSCHTSGKKQELVIGREGTVVYSQLSIKICNRVVTEQPGDHVRELTDNQGSKLTPHTSLCLVYCLDLTQKCICLHGLGCLGFWSSREAAAALVELSHKQCKDPFAVKNLQDTANPRLWRCASRAENFYPLQWNLRWPKMLYLLLE